MSDGYNWKTRARKWSRSVGPELIDKVITKVPTRYERYKWYIKYSDKWQIKRAQRMKIDNYMCKCGATENLEVHHITYKNLFDEPMIDLETLCHKCHEEKHKPLFVGGQNEKLGE